MPDVGRDPAHPTFLTTPDRPQKPRGRGLTHVLDKGYPLEHVRWVLAASAGFIDLWKFGWGTAYVDAELGDKLAVLAANDIRACPGGTLLEIAWLQNRTSEFFDWAVAAGFGCVEVSNGATGLPAPDKRRLIREAAERGFDVLAEVGSKDPRVEIAPEHWAEEIEADLAAGARWVVTEGRESGTVGLFDADGAVRSDIVDAIERHVECSQLIFEAPRRNQQAWLIRHFGPTVNLGNIGLDEITGVETLRLGLRVDTIGIGVDGAAGLEDGGSHARRR